MFKERYGHVRVPLSFEFRVPEDEDDDDDGTGDWYGKPSVSTPLFAFRPSMAKPPCHTRVPRDVPRLIILWASAVLCCIVQVQVDHAS